MNIAPHINLWLMAAANLRRYRAKSIAVMVPLGLVMAVAAFMMFARGGFVREAGLARVFLPHITVQGVAAGRVEKISLGVMDRIAKIPHMRSVVPRVWGYLPMQLKEANVSYTLMGLDMTRAVYDEKMPWTLATGTFLVPGDRGKVVLGSGVARSFAARVNDRLKIADALGNKAEFTVVGIFNTAVQVYSTDLIVTSLEDARSFFGYRRDEASDLLVYVDRPEKADEVAWTITNLFPNTRVLTGKALTELVREAFSRRGGTFQMVWLILLLTVLLLVWAQASHINVDLSREIGVLKALGWHTGEIIEMKMMESFLLGFTGTLSGILVGFIYVLLGTPGLSGYCLGCASIYPKYPIPVDCDFPSLALLFILGVLPMTAVSAIPAWLTGTIDPDTAIRR